jgi:hypothetical protein
MSQFMYLSMEMLMGRRGVSFVCSDQAVVEGARGQAWGIARVTNMPSRA